MMATKNRFQKYKQKLIEWIILKKKIHTLGRGRIALEANSNIQEGHEKIKRESI